MNYNYVFFNIQNGKWEKDEKEYNSICVRDLIDREEIQVVEFPLEYAPRFIRLLYRLNYSKKINRIIKLPFKKMWYPYVFKSKFINNKPLCFIVSGSYVQYDYITFLRRKYPNCKIVRINRDLMQVFYLAFPDITPDNVHNVFDLHMSYDKNESIKYNLIHFNEFESKIKIPISQHYPIYDVFFSGTAKDRLPLLMDIYHRLTSTGLVCHYYLFGVPKDKRIPYDNIEYADKYMSYYDMLYYTVNSKCVLDINQAGAVGYTSRFIEAIMYNKKLLSNNPAVKESVFFNDINMQYFDSAQDISEKFIENIDSDINYNYNNEFSPINLIYQIDNELSKKIHSITGGKND